MPIVASRSAAVGDCVDRLGEDWLTSTRVRARAKSSRFCTVAHCLLGGSLTRGFASRLDAPVLSGIDRVILAVALTGLGAPLRLAVACLLILGAACSKAAVPVEAPLALGLARADLTPAQLAAFERGKAVFSHVYTERDGLGPHFNAMACSECHNLPSLGGHGPAELKARVLFDRAQSFVGVLPVKTIAGHAPLTVPAGGILDFRRGPPLFGLGLLERLTDAELAANCDPSDRNGDGVRGHTNVNTNYDGRPGRFGLQAHTSSIRDFVGNALVGEMGVTNLVNRDPLKWADRDAVADPEAPTQTVDDLTAYVAGLAAPPRARAASAADTARWAAGEGLFVAVGCAGCHQANPGVAVAGAYTDLCVHSLGPAFDSRIEDFSAKGDEWRTAPLWGLRFRKQYFHDARTGDLDAAVRMHGGEASSAAKNYSSLSSADRTVLIGFLDSL